MRKIITAKIEFKLFIYLIIIFIIITVIGTVFHEFGHYLAAKLLGIDSKIYYGYTSFIHNENYRHLSKIDRIIILCGGPIQTIFTGTLGLVLLFIFKKEIFKFEKLSFKYWIFIFLSLFWLRQTANFFMWIIGYLLTGRFSKKGDEIRLANLLDIPIWSIILPTAILGITVALITVFIFIPLKQRFTFIISGLIGGVLGYIIWLEFLGKILMP